MKILTVFRQSGCLKSTLLLYISNNAPTGSALPKECGQIGKSPIQKTGAALFSDFYSPRSAAAFSQMSRAAAFSRATASSFLPLSSS